MRHNPKSKPNLYFCVLPKETYMRMNKNYGILITSVALFFLVIQIYFFATAIASKEEKRLEVTALKENEEIVALLKASIATPIARIQDSLMSVKKLNKIAGETEIDSKAVDNFVKILDDPDLYGELSVVDKRNVIRLLSNVPGLSDELFQNLLNTFDTNIDELNRAVYNLMNRSENPLSYRQAINHLFSDAPELTSLIRKKHAKQFQHFQPSSK